jgi:hypothetical protein
MLRVLRMAAIGLACSGLTVNASAQVSQLVFTSPIPGPTPSTTTPPASVVVEERGLAWWAGAVSDFGLGVTLSGPQWTLRSMTSMTVLPVAGQRRPTYQQIEVVRPVFSFGSLSIAGGGGIRQEWDGTRTVVGRLLAQSEVGKTRFQGGVVVERATSSPVERDSADVITSVGWSRRLGDQISVGFEGIGQDLEGLWNPAEADGGAKLLVGPSLHAQSRSAKWTASLVAGPVVHSPSSVTPPNVARATSNLAGRHFGLFASASWMP